MKKYLKLCITVFCTVTFLATAYTVNAETVSKYNSSETLTYAESHWNDGKGDCIAFARACVEAGGVPRDSARSESSGTGYTVKQYIDYMVHNGYAELIPLIKEKMSFGQYYINIEKNAGKVTPGDIIVYKCGNSSCKKPYFHASVCAPSQQQYSYYYYYYDHNGAAAGNQGHRGMPLCSIDHSSCGQSGGRANVSMYALHITSPENGYSSVYNSAAVNGLKVTCTAYNKLKISWNPVDADKYVVFMKKSSNGFFTRLITTEKNSVIYTVPKDYYAGNFYFSVRPCKVIKGKAYVGKLSKTEAGHTLPDKPVNLTAKLYSYRSAKVSWTRSGGATGYYVEYRPAGATKWSWLTDTSNNYASRSNLTAGVKYYFRITPYTTSKVYKGKMTGMSDTVSVTMLKKVNSPAVVKDGAGYVKVSWSRISGASGYQVGRSVYKDKNFTILKSVSGSSLKVKTAKNRTYYYAVRAYRIVDGKKIVTPWSYSKKYILR